MDADKVFRRLLLFTQDPREELLLQLSADAAAALSERIAADAKAVAAREEALVTAAAADAAYRLALLDGALSPDSVTAGDVKAEYAGNVRQAEAYRGACFAAVSGLLRDDGFDFKEVRTW